MVKILSAGFLNKMKYLAGTDSFLYKNRLSEFFHRLSLVNKSGEPFIQLRLTWSLTSLLEKHHRQAILR